MHEDPENTRSLRERIGGSAEDRLGRALSELLESPLFTGAIGRAFDAREKASQAQEVALSALNLPSAADIERLTRRLRSVSHRLEGIEEGVDRLDSSLSPRTMEARLAAIERQLESLAEKLNRAVQAIESAPASDRAPLGAKPAKGVGARSTASAQAAKVPAAKAPAAKAPAAKAAQQLPVSTGRAGASAPGKPPAARSSGK